MKKLKKRKMKKPRNMVVLGMLLTCKAKVMKDRREPRGGAKNEQRELLDDSEA